MKTTKTITRIIMIVICVSFLTSCTTFKEAGRVSMISSKSVDAKANYQLLKKSTEYTKDELKKIKTETIEAAIDEVIKKVDGGEYLMNVKVHQIAHQKYGQKMQYNYAVEGDVWGTKK